jgi:hypothetical protein
MFGDFDGRIRLVSKVGRSRAAAERAVKEEPGRPRSLSRSGLHRADRRWPTRSEQRVR